MNDLPFLFRASEVQDEAIKCRYCHESLVDSAAKWQEFRHRYEAMSREEQAAAWRGLSVTQQKVLAEVMAGHPIPARPAGPTRSNALAFILGLLLGPVGLWYKGHWAAGFAWLVMAIIVGALTGLIAAPLFWFGMAIHAAVAEPRN